MYTLLIITYLPGGHVLVLDPRESGRLVPAEELDPRRARLTQPEESKRGLC